MKRYLASAALLFVAVLVFLGELRARPVLRADEKIDSQTVRLHATAPGVRVVEDQQPFDPMRQQLLERIKAKIQLMSDEDVQKAVEATNIEIDELQAAVRLKHASDMLQSIIDDYGKTQSARRAAQMMDANIERPTSNCAPGFSPFGLNQPTSTPDPRATLTPR